MGCDRLYLLTLMRHAEVVLAALGFALTSLARAQVTIPLGDSHLEGRVYDSITGAPVLRTSICQEGGTWPRCVHVDTLGRYVLDSLLPAANRITVACVGAGRKWLEGKDIADTTVVLRLGERRRLDFPTTTSGCDSRPFHLVRGTFRGHYSSGFEQSEFIPCPADVLWARTDSAGESDRELRAWVEWPRHHQTPGGPSEWPAPKLVHPPWDYPQYFVRWTGTLEGPDHYGHMDASPYKFAVDSIIEVRTPGSADCVGP